MSTNDELKSEPRAIRMSTPTLITERLSIRRFTERDIDALHLIVADRATNEFLPWFPAETLEDTRRFYATRCADRYATGTGYTYAICLTKADRPVGYVTVDGRAPYDLGYALRHEFWHRGIATEATRAVVAQAQADGLPYLTATHDRRNPRSGQVMQKLGMTYRYSYEELWQPKNVLVTFRMYQLNLADKDAPTYQGYAERYPVHFVETER